MRSGSARATVRRSGGARGDRPRSRAGRSRGGRSIGASRDAGDQGARSTRRRREACSLPRGWGLLAIAGAVVLWLTISAPETVERLRAEGGPGCPDGDQRSAEVAPGAAARAGACSGPREAAVAPSASAPLPSDATGAEGTGRGRLPVPCRRNPKPPRRPCPRKHRRPIRSSPRRPMRVAAAVSGNPEAAQSAGPPEEGSGRARRAGLGAAPGPPWRDPEPANRPRKPVPVPAQEAAESAMAAAPAPAEPAPRPAPEAAAIPADLAELMTPNRDRPGPLPEGGAGRHRALAGLRGPSCRHRRSGRGARGGGSGAQHRGDRAGARPAAPR